MANKKAFVVALLVLGGIAAALRWYDWVYFISAAVVIAAICGGSRIAARLTAVPSRYRRHGQLAVQQSRAGTLLRGISLGLLAAIATFVLHGLASQLPSIQQFLYDGDRTHFEEIADRLEQNGHHAEIAELIDQRLQQPVSDLWSSVLREREYDNWIKAGKQHKGDESRKLYQRAVATADQAGMRHDLADELLQRLQDAQRMAEIVAVNETSSQQSQKTVKAISASLHDVVTVVFDQFIQWGDSLGNQFELRRSKYETAAAWAKQHSLNPDLAVKRLADLQSQIDSMRPASLPAGTSIRLLQQNCDSRPPITIADIAVCDAAGQAIRGLASKDFRIRIGGHSTAAPQVALVTPTGRPIQLMILVDRSNSTSGPPLEAAKSGVKSFVRDVEGNAIFKLLSFGDTVRSLTDWTSSAGLISNAVDSIRADGSTALFQVVDVAAAELESRPAPRAIVLITDGKDHIGGPSPADLIARCRKSSITLHVIGLKTPELDPDLLRSFCRETGGSFQMAEQSSELGKKLLSIAALLRRPFYRIVIPDDGNMSETVELQVGANTPALRLSKIASPQ